MSKNPHENCFIALPYKTIEIIDRFGKLELECDTSAGEYASELFPIQFCPFCGEKSKTEKEHE